MYIYPELTGGSLNDREVSLEGHLDGLLLRLIEGMQTDILHSQVLHLSTLLQDHLRDLI